jgi:hypothetical protein
MKNEEWSEYAYTENGVEKKAYYKWAEIKPYWDDIGGMLHTHDFVWKDGSAPAAFYEENQKSFDRHMKFMYAVLIALVLGFLGMVIHICSVGRC